MELTKTLQLVGETTYVHYDGKDGIEVNLEELITKLINRSEPQLDLYDIKPIKHAIDICIKETRKWVDGQKSKILPTGYEKICKNNDHNKIINFKNKTISCVCEEKEQNE